MPQSPASMTEGVFGTADLQLLSRVYAQTVSLHDSEAARTNSARTILNLWRSGVVDEAELVRICTVLRNRDENRRAARASSFVRLANGSTVE